MTFQVLLLMSLLLLLLTLVQLLLLIDVGADVGAAVVVYDCQLLKS